MRQFPVVLLCVLVALTGCAKKNKVVAKVGTHSVTVGTLTERIQEAPPGYQSYLRTTAGKKQFLDLLVRERVVMEAARKAGVTSRQEYKKALAEFRKEQSRRSRDYEENLLMELYVKDLHAKQLAVSDADVEKYYQEHKTEYARPVEVVARHILVPTKQEAEKVLERLKQGEDFAAVAKDVSTDPVSAVRGGQIGPFRKGDLVPEFETAVFAIKIGQTAGPVETQFGWHVIRKVSEKVLPARPAAEAKMDIKKMLEKMRFDDWYKATKDALGVKVSYDLLSQVTVPSSMDALAPEACPPDEQGK